MSFDNHDVIIVCLCDGYALSSRVVVTVYTLALIITSVDISLCSVGWALTYNVRVPWMKSNKRQWICLENKSALRIHIWLK